MSEPIITFSVVGLGHIGKRHIEILRGHPQCELVSACDIDPTVRTAVGAKLDIPIFPSLAQMLQAPILPDVVCICTPNGLHATHALQVLEAGCHAVIEKPMGLSKESCEQVLFQALRQNKQVFCVMQNRYSPPSQWLRSVIDQQLLGEILHVQVNCFWNRDDRYYQAKGWKGSLAMDGGPLFTQFSHFIDTLYWLLGDITDIQARFENFRHQHNTEFEDSGIVSFRLQGGGMGSFNYSTANWNRNYESSIMLQGTQGTIKVGGQYMERIVHCDVDAYEQPVLPPSNPPNDYGTYKGSAANHHFVFENVVQTLSGTASISTNALEGLKVVDIIERIYALRDLSDLAD